jgi:glucokinase
MSHGSYDILAADIGGTSARFAHFTGDAPNTLAMRDSVWLETGKSSSFGGLLDMLRESGLRPLPEEADMVSLAVAGPVVGGVRSHPPNISWDVDLGSAGLDYGFDRFALINDFAAQAYACRSPAVDGAARILQGEVDPDAVVSVVGAGTGLGQAALIPDGRGGWIAMPTEGGHQPFAFVTDEEFEYLKFARRALGREHVIGDHVVSGTGLSLVHRFLTGEDLDPAEVSARLDQSPRTLELFARFYGRACRNFALVTLPLGGLYVSGGVAAKNPDLIDNRHFEAGFMAGETHRELMARIPVFLNDNQDSGLYGAAMKGVQALTLQ